MLRRPAGTLISVLGAATIVAGLGGAAIAGSGGASVKLTPTSELSNGGAAAPTSGEVNGAVEAPASAPAPVEAPAPAPPTAAPAPATDPVSAPVTDGAPAPEETTAVPVTPEGTDPAPEPDAAATEPAAAEIVDEPTEEDIGENGSQLVPVAMLDTPIGSVAKAKPLIDIAPEPADAPALERDAGTLAGTAQNGDDGGDDDEVVIPVPPEDTDEPNGNPPADGDGGVTPETRPTGDRGLPFTGVEVQGPLAAGFILLLLGAFLRMTAPATSRPVRV